jgi:hypothetical protein
MQSLLNPSLFFGPTTYTAQQVREMYEDGLPEATKKAMKSDAGSDFSTDAGRSYVMGLATYLTGSDERPACTLANLTALVQHPDFKEVIALLMADAITAPFVQVLHTAIENGVEGAVAMVLTTVRLRFSHLSAGRVATHAIQELLAVWEERPA